MSEPLTSKTIAIPERELWSLVRSILEQGRDIQVDYAYGVYSSYEHCSARVDEAARERADKLLQKYGTADEPKASEPHVIKQIEHALRDCPDKISREMADYITGCIADYRHAVTKSATVPVLPTSEEDERIVDAAIKRRLSAETEGGQS